MSACLLTTGMTLYIPFGSVCVISALGPHRPKMVGTLQVVAPKKKLTRKQAKEETAAAPQTDGKETYALWAFIPLLRKKDSEQRPDIALSVYSRLLAASHHMPKKWSDSPDVQKWMSMLKLVSEEAKNASKSASNCEMHDADP